MFRTFARGSQEASGVNGVRRPRKNPRIRLSTAAVRCRRTFAYHADGQLASATVGRGDPTAPTSESFLWDGLALIQRGDEQFINEPHVGGGNPVASSKGTSYFNDALGTTVGAKSNGKYSAAVLTAFGENVSVDSPTPTQNSNFFTGKPYVEGLGHAFWMRNYRAGLAKWQTADPMGYPDGWNQLAYCGNGVVSRVDYLGCSYQKWERAREFPVQYREVLP
jgi:RHS repeat-associated protein